MWEYRCRVLDLYDGDTLTLRVDLGFHTYTDIRVRLLNIDTPEIRGQEREWGLEAKEFAENWIDTIQLPHIKWPFICKTEKTGKYGRWLADLRSAYSDEWLTDALKAAGFDTEDWKEWS